MYRWGDDRGFATLLGAFAIATIAAVAVAMLYVGGAVVARHRAQSAADLAALAAAQQHVLAAPEPCRAAEEIAQEQRVGARIERCAADGIDVVLTVAVPVRLGPFGVRDALASARAGPVD
ncbi:hypothetical protein GIY30_20525 [Gordonia sp. HNM0687]|uniref:Putative Flp pilus-assembly TadG-like N-terminal domain-containing protein n=1 Tax=Gordonia mangrovi TaxID=2665643 RepID=A0A6L7GW83_9ACTN|nr:Rv3654c family TadE-like protein [Gordonia mangrovi]MDY6808843.1 Rv3654c family TadE-like protein [Actinomycetota bacterium]MXP23727.1 hypothetical protein [Gordonia mangrovi]UVF79784.1 flp pilus-assembly TadE/G-like family protein [Gordonia mangrovi]